MLKLSLALYCDCLNGEVCTNTVYINIAMHFHTFYTMHVCDWWPQYWPQCLTRGSTCLWLVTKVSYQGQHMSMTDDNSLTRGSTCLWLVTTVLPGATHVYDWWPQSYQGQHTCLWQSVRGEGSAHGRTLWTADFAEKRCWAKCLTVQVPGTVPQSSELPHPCKTQQNNNEHFAVAVKATEMNI